MERSKRDVKKPRRLSPDVVDQPARKPLYKADASVARECVLDDPDDIVAPVERLVKKYNADAGSDWQSIRYPYQYRGVTCKAYRAFTLVTTTKLPRRFLGDVRALWDKGVGSDKATVSMPLCEGPQAILVAVKALKTEVPYTEPTVPDIPEAESDDNAEAEPDAISDDNDETVSDDDAEADAPGPSRAPQHDLAAQLLELAQAMVKQSEAAAPAVAKKATPVVNRALKVRNERFNAFLKTDAYGDYQAFRAGYTGDAKTKIEKEIKHWVASGQQAPAVHEAFVPLLKGIMRDHDKGSPEYERLDRIVGRCKKLEAKLYCGNEGCTKPATRVSLADWVAFHRDDESRAELLRDGCFQATHVMNMFKAYSYVMSADRPVAFCRTHVAVPSVRFDHTSNRTCMCCMDNSIGGNVGSNAASSTYAYWLCGECESKCAGRSDGNVRVGIMEDVVAEGLRVYARIATLLYPEVAVTVRQQVPVQGAGDVDIGVDAGIVRHYIEINGDGHDLAKDMDTKMRAAFETRAPGTKVVWWMVRVFKNAPDVVETVRQHWLRMHSLSVVAGLGHVPTLQVVLVNVSDTEHKNVRRFLKGYVKSDQFKSFLEHNVHVITGVPSPASGLSPTLRLLYQCRDVVGNHGEFSPIRTVWDWNVWDNKVGASRQGAARMKIPVCSPPAMREAEMDVPDTLGLGLMVRAVRPKGASPPPPTP
jgi:hypothetical protein